MRLAPTQPAASNATVLLDGLAMVSNAQIWMNAPMGHTCAATMPTVTTPWAHIAAHARKDFLEMGSSAQTATSVPRTATSVRVATA